MNMNIMLYLVDRALAVVFTVACTDHEVCGNVQKAPVFIPGIS